MWERDIPHLNIHPINAANIYNDNSWNAVSLASITRTVADEAKIEATPPIVASSTSHAYAAAAAAADVEELDGDDGDDDSKRTRDAAARAVHHR